MTLTYKCGCEIDHLYHENINFDCEATWEIFDKGLTMGVFQLEKPLGKMWSKRLAPVSIKETSDLISLIRPGCLNSGMTEKYRGVKWKETLPSYIHDDLREILEPTHSCLVYQEQCMEIARKMCGFSLQEADKMRKGIGKKDEKILKALSKQFIKGGVEHGYDKKSMQEIWGWIVEFADYGFNKSHGISYAYLSYATAYYKAHFTNKFFMALLEFSQYEQKPREYIDKIEIEAKLWNIGIHGPKLRQGNWNFELDENGNIYFGLGHLKSMTKKAKDVIGYFIDCNDIEGFLGKLQPCKSKYEYVLSKGEVEALIKSGAMDNYEDGLNRNERLKLFSLYRILNDGEKKKYSECDTKLIKFIKGLTFEYQSDARRKRRIVKLQKALLTYDSAPSKCLPAQIVKYEGDYLGITPSGTLADYKKNDKFTHRCIDIPQLLDRTQVTLKVVLDSFRKFTSKKNGKDMIFMTISDSSYTLDSCVMFESTMNKYFDSLELGQAMLVKGPKSRSAMIIEKITFL